MRCWLKAVKAGDMGEGEGQSRGDIDVMPTREASAAIPFTQAPAQFNVAVLNADLAQWTPRRQGAAMRPTTRRVETRCDRALAS